MGKFLKRAIILSLGLFTLVGCTKPASKHNLRLDYNSLDELKENIATAELKDGVKSSGVYVFDDKVEGPGALKPSSITSSLYTACTKDQLTTMRKDNLVIDTENFVIETTIKFAKTESVPEKVYVLNSRITVNTDVFKENFPTPDKYKIGVFEATNPLYEDKPSCFFIGAFYDGDGDKDKVEDLHLMYVNSKESKEETKNIALALFNHMKYVKIGK